jgi:hypothetical protein
MRSEQDIADIRERLKQAEADRQDATQILGGVDPTNMTDETDQVHVRLDFEIGQMKDILQDHASR